MIESQEIPLYNNTTTTKLENLHILETQQRDVDKAPFRMLRIDDSSILNTISGREICEKCFKSRKFFCYTCYSPVIDQKYFPQIKLPIKIDIIKHRREIDGKSTAVHAAILAPNDVKIYTYPDFPTFAADEKVVLIFPTKNASSVESLVSHNQLNDNQDEIIGNKNIPITRAVFIDSTWNQTKSIYKDERIRALPCIILKSRISQFWRHQKKSPRWYLSTIEAIHQFLVELHICTYGSVEQYIFSNQNIISTKKYCGQYDNLLYLFKYMYDKIHTIYDHNQLKAYRRPLT